MNKTIQKGDFDSKDGNDFITVFMVKSVIQINDVVVTGQIIPVMAKQSIYKVQTISNLK
ncbi:hypothetical protein EMGBS15_18420 [Filimonas sp.]|nr:hypothetical protein EMGBS15_18420 [Filimonas sp.]